MPMFGKWSKVLEVPCKRRVRGRLEDLGFAQMYWHLVTFEQLARIELERV